MLKFLLVLFVIWVLARLAKRWLLAKALRMQQSMAEQLHAQMRSQMGSQMGAGLDDGASAPEARGSSGAERMVACALCGLHFPQSEAVANKGQLYCCADHAQQHAA